MHKIADFIHYFWYGTHLPPEPPFYEDPFWISLVILIIVGPIVLWKVPKARQAAQRLLLHIFDSFYEPKIITVQQIVVTYRFPKTRNILAIILSNAPDDIVKTLVANPNADLKKLQDALGVSILNIQGQSSRRFTSPTPPFI